MTCFQIILPLKHAFMCMIENYKSKCNKPPQTNNVIRPHMIKEFRFETDINYIRTQVTKDTEIGNFTSEN